MAGKTEENPGVNNPAPEERDDRLDSWKAIAAYLGRSDKTVRRWEEKEGLPVHRLHHDKRGSIYAYKSELDSWFRLRQPAMEAPEDLPVDSLPEPEPRRRGLPQPLWWAAAGIMIAAVLLDVWLPWHPARVPVREIHFSRITEFVGMEESPAISPDGKMVAFVARSAGHRQIWIRMLAAGPPAQITHDDIDHEHPRWTPDSGSLIYYSPSATPGNQGSISEIPALGGPPQRIAAALGGGDCSHDGKLIALFRSNGGVNELVKVDRRGARIERVAKVESGDLNQCPRWSPDDQWIAFQSNSGASFEAHINVVAAGGGPVRVLARTDDLRGVTWSSDGSALVYSSSAGSTILYPPVFNLRDVSWKGTGDHQLTFGDVSYLEPDQQAGRIAVSCIRNQSDIWRFPIGGSALENTRAGIRVTSQTGQVQTPSVSPDGKEVVYLSDSGGHGNLWISGTDGSGVRQLTFERDPAVAVGAPVWSPSGDYILFILTRKGNTAQWVIHPDGSGLRQLIPAGVLADWSTDGRWVYYVKLRNSGYTIEKLRPEGSPPILVRSDNAVAPAATDGTSLYYATILNRGYNGWDFEFRHATPETGSFESLIRITGAQVPYDASLFQMVLSPDRKWLAAPLTNGTTSNIWLLPGGGGPLRQVTDFGPRTTLIVRRVSWSPDSRQVYAAIADCDADIVMLDGLENQS